MGLHNNHELFILNKKQGSQSLQNFHLHVINKILFLLTELKKFKKWNLCVLLWQFV